MIEIGKKQTLIVVKLVDFGVYLNETVDSGEGNVLLPRKQVPKGIKRGDKLEVFIYRDSSDRLIATVNEPLLMLGELGMLTVKQITKIGAFLDWGLEKDLLLPYKEQTGKLREGKSYLVCLYEDKSHRLCATMKLYHRLSLQSPYHEGDHVEGVVYEKSDNYGVFVAVDNLYSARIAQKEVHQPIRVGDTIKARVVKVLEDGKLELSLYEKAYLQMDVDAAMIMDSIESYDGVLPFNDKASPERIEEEFHISKAAFKRAVGRLLKQHKIELTSNGIKRV